MNASGNARTAYLPPDPHGSYFLYPSTDACFPGNFDAVAGGRTFERQGAVARRPRILFPGAIYHVMSRGNRKGPIFDDDGDRDLFLSTLYRAVRRYEARCFAYCLMGNHYHLLLETPRGNVSDVMRHINGVYTQAANRRHSRSGHVFEGRFRSIVIDRESYLRRASRYIVRNPVRSGFVHSASSWRWSSYCATAGLAAPPPFLDEDWIDWAFAASSREEAQFKYRLYVNDALPEMFRPESTAEVFGSRAFESRLRTFVVSDDIDRPLPRAWRALGRPALATLFRNGGGSLAERDRLIRHAHVVYGYRLAEIAAHLRVHASTASIALRRAEAAEAKTSA